MYWDPGNALKIESVKDRKCVIRFRNFTIKPCAMYSNVSIVLPLDYMVCVFRHHFCSLKSLHMPSDGCQQFESTGCGSGRSKLYLWEAGNLSSSKKCLGRESYRGKNPLNLRVWCPLFSWSEAEKWVLAPGPSFWKRKSNKEIPLYSPACLRAHCILPSPVVF